MSLISAGIGAAANIVGGLIGREGQKDANAANLAIAREQMDFQREMSNTAYRRAATDLKAAGLNRILALGNPASSPAGSSAVMQNENAGVPEAVNAATSKIRLNEELKLLREQQDQVRVQTNKTATDAAVSVEEVENKKAERELMNQQKAESLQREIYMSEQSRAQKAEADMLEVTRAAYTAAKPFVEKVLEEIPGAVQSGKSTVKNFVERLPDHAAEAKNSAKGAWEWYQNLWRWNKGADRPATFLHKR